MRPNLPGVPWWAAVLIAVTATGVGFAFDAGADVKELTNVFAAMYVIGCVAAVVTVRHSAIFTAVIQPPLILFVSVPGAYFLLQGSEITGLRDVLINCGYPLIERFPLMLFTSAVVLLLGSLRWYVGMSVRAVINTETSTKEDAGGITATVASLAGILSPGRTNNNSPKGRHALDTGRRARRAAGAADADKARKRPTRVRSPKQADPALERPRRSSDIVPWEGAPPPDPRRYRAPAPRTAGDPYERRDTYERRAPHDRRAHYENDDPFEPYERPGVNGAAASTSTHHPISRVRYRSAVADQD